MKHNALNFWIIAAVIIHALSYTQSTQAAQPRKPISYWICTYDHVITNKFLETRVKTVAHGDVSGPFVALCPALPENVYVNSDPKAFTEHFNIDPIIIDDPSDISCTHQRGVLIPVYE